MKKILLSLCFFSFLGFYPLISKAADDILPIIACTSVEDCKALMIECNKETNPDTKSKFLAEITTSIETIKNTKPSDEMEEAFQANEIATANDDLKKLENTQAKAQEAVDNPPPDAPEKTIQETKQKLEDTNKDISDKTSEIETATEEYNKIADTPYDPANPPQIDETDLVDYNSTIKNANGAANLLAEVDKHKVVLAIERLVAKTGTFEVTKLLTATDKSGEALLTLTGGNDNSNILTRIIKLLIQLLGTMSILLYVIAAFFMITSQGDENQLQKGKTIFIYTTIGLAVAFTSYILVQFVLNIIFINN
ncbi:hypothetical protein KAI58_04440 [Candidatus Gracilibacteria bacterium]|nr:hypothetical protein [Candidatus Gracilibacteria bacterium]